MCLSTPVDHLPDRCVANSSFRLCLAKAVNLLPCGLAESSGYKAHLSGGFVEAMACIPTGKEKACAFILDTYCICVHMYIYIICIPANLLIYVSI